MKTVLAITLLALSGSFAIADDNGQKPAYGTKSIRFSDLKTACLEPARFQNQTAPTNIQISCQDIEYKWVPSNDGSVNMDRNRFITTSVISDKYSVSPEKSALSLSPQVANCPRYKRVAETVNFTRSVTCSEIVDYSGNAADFCSSLVSDLRASNPDGVEVEETGHVVDLCSVKASDNRGQTDHGRGQKD